MKNMEKMFLAGGVAFPNTNCQAAHPDEIYKCFYASEIIKFMDPSI
jgi:hypothetical protein